jgi:hypothetical protein
MFQSSLWHIGFSVVLFIQVMSHLLHGLKYFLNSLLRHCQKLHDYENVGSQLTCHTCSQCPIYNSLRWILANPWLYLVCWSLYVSISIKVCYLMDLSCVNIVHAIGLYFFYKLCGVYFVLVISLIIGFHTRLPIAIENNFETWNNNFGDLPLLCR